MGRQEYCARTILATTNDVTRRLPFRECRGVADVVCVVRGRVIAAFLQYHFDYVFPTPCLLMFSAVAPSAAPLPRHTAAIRQRESPNLIVHLVLVHVDLEI